MKKSQEALLSLIIEAANSGKSLKISEKQREDAAKLVDDGICYWSLDYDHVSVYDKH
jgi:hypothetical protein